LLARRPDTAGAAQPRRHGRKERRCELARQAA
jgi:hypothetical protein